MPRKKTVKIVEDEEEKTNKNLIMLDSNSIQILDTWIKGVGL